MLSIQTNVNSMNAQENLRITNDFQARTIARLTSGYRINQSGDDAAGLAVANKFRSDIAELTQGVRNANDGLSTMQIIDGGLSNVSKMLDRLKTLATQSASSSFEGDRATLDREFQALTTEIDRQAGNIGLSNAAGSASRYNKNLNVYIGGGGDYSANSGVAVDLSCATDRVNSTALGLTGQTILGGDGTVFSAGNLQTGSVTADQTFTFVSRRDHRSAKIYGQREPDDDRRSEAVERSDRILRRSRFHRERRPDVLQQQELHRQHNHRCRRPCHDGETSRSART